MEILTKRKGETIESFRARVNKQDADRLAAKNKLIADTNKRIKASNKKLAMTPEALAAQKASQAKVDLVKDLDRDLSGAGKTKTKPNANANSVADIMGPGYNTYKGKLKKLNGNGKKPK